MELATPEAFAEDPAHVWRFYEWRREQLRKARPNAAHEALARIEDVLSRMTLVTQNVDGLHRAAGSRNVIELHGTILKTRCTGCGERADGPGRAVPVAPAALRLRRPPAARTSSGSARRCPRARSRRPRRRRARAPSSSSSGPLPSSRRRRRSRRSRRAAGAKVFEINPEETPLAPLADGTFRASASAVLPLLADALERGAA